jgi:hypothetical protein
MHNEELHDLSYQVKEDEGGTCSTNGEKQNHL